MKTAPLPKEVATVILEAINNALNSSDSFFRYTVGEDSNFCTSKKEYVDSQLHELISNRLLV